GAPMEVVDRERLRIPADAVREEARIRVDLRVERVEVLHGRQYERRARSAERRNHRAIDGLEEIEEETRVVQRRLAPEQDVPLRRKTFDMERAGEVLRHARDP